MRVFMIFELVVVFILLYLILNLLRYFFFRNSKGQWFGLSDRWIEQERKDHKDKKNGNKEA